MGGSEDGGAAHTGRDGYWEHWERPGPREAGVQNNEQRAATEGNERRSVDRRISCTAVADGAGGRRTAVAVTAVSNRVGHQTGPSGENEELGLGVKAEPRSAGKGRLNIEC